MDKYNVGDEVRYAGNTKTGKISRIKDDPRDRDCPPVYYIENYDKGYFSSMLHDTFHTMITQIGFVKINESPLTYELPYSFDG